jgi:hypothetical protein
MSSAILMAKDMQFYMVQGKVLQFTASICRKMYLIYQRKLSKKKKVAISYHGGYNLVEIVSF